MIVICDELADAAAGIAAATASDQAATRSTQAGRGATSSGVQVGHSADNSSRAVRVAAPRVSEEARDGRRRAVSEASGV